MNSNNLLNNILEKFIIYLYNNFQRSRKVKVTKIQIKGVCYLKCSKTNKIYDFKTKESIGTWNSITKSIDEEDDSDDDDDEYEDEYTKFDTNYIYKHLQQVHIYNEIDNVECSLELKELNKIINSFIYENFNNDNDYNHIYFSNYCLRKYCIKNIQNNPAKIQQEFSSKIYQDYKIEYFEDFIEYSINIKRYIRTNSTNKTFDEIINRVLDMLNENSKVTLK